MAKNNDTALPVFGLFLAIIGIPCNLFMGFLTGLVAPVAAIAASALCSQITKV